MLTGNYGEAGALDRARRDGAAVPPVYSGHNAYGLWGPPRVSSPVLLVGDDSDLSLFGGCRVLARVDNGVGLDNDEQGTPVRWCAATTAPWTTLWPRTASSADDRGLDAPPGSLSSRTCTHRSTPRCAPGRRCA